MTSVSITSSVVAWGSAMKRVSVEMSGLIDAGDWVIGAWRNEPIPVAPGRDNRPMDSALDERTQDSMEREIASCLEGMNALHARVLELAGEVRSRQLHRFDGARNVADWLTQKLNIGHKTAWHWAQLADALRELPMLAKSYACGEVSFDQTRLLARIATPETESGVLEDFGHCSVAELELLARKHRDHGEPAQHSRLRMRFDGDNTFHVNGTLLGADGAVVAAALARECQRIFDERRKATSDVTTLTGHDQCMAEALVNLARQHIVDDSDADRAQIVVHAPVHYLDTLRGEPNPGRLGLDLPELADAAHISTDTLRRLGCDSRLQLVIEDDRGRPVAISSTQRTVPVTIARLVKHRDRGRRFPGCGARRFIHVHHLHHWSLGGRTEWSNLVSLCPFHHHLVHEGGWTITGDPDSTLTFVSPYRIRHTSDPPNRAA